MHGKNRLQTPFVPPPHPLGRDGALVRADDVLKCPLIADVWNDRIESIFQLRCWLLEWFYECECQTEVLYQE